MLYVLTEGVQHAGSTQQDNCLSLQSALQGPVVKELACFIQGAAPAVSHARATHDHSQGTSKHPAQQDTARGTPRQQAVSGNIRQRVAKAKAADSSAIAAMEVDNHADRMQVASTAAVQSSSDLIPNDPLSAGQVNYASAAAPQSNPLTLQTSDTAELPMNLVKIPAEEERNPAATPGSSPAATDTQSQRDLAKSKHLHCLEAAAAEWRQRSASAAMSTIKPQSQHGTGYTIISQRGVLSQSITEAQSRQSQHPRHDVESQYAAGNYSQDAVMSGTNAAVPSARPELDSMPCGCTLPGGVPPPPPKPEAFKPKAKGSWWAALKGDVPPWEL